MMVPDAWRGEAARAGRGAAGGDARRGYLLGSGSRVTRSPTTVPLASIVPVGSSSTPFAPRTNGTRPVHVRSDRWTLSTVRDPSDKGLLTNTASIGNRMNIMWIPLL